MEPSTEDLVSFILAKWARETDADGLPPVDVVPLWLAAKGHWPGLRLEMFKQAGLIAGEQVRAGLDLRTILH